MNVNCEVSNGFMVGVVSVKRDVARLETGVGSIRSVDLLWTHMFQVKWIYYHFYGLIIGISKLSEPGTMAVRISSMKFII